MRIAYDAVFLDIAMRRMNGVELAHAIRKKDKKLPIAFLTADSAFAIEGYEVRAVRYLLKPITADKLDSLLDELLAERHRGMEDNISITISENGATKRIAEGSICYMEVLGHYTHLHLADAPTIRIKESLAAVVAHIHRKEQFVKCHRSYVVNLSYVEKITRTDCTLSDNTILPVSRSAYQLLNVLQGSMSMKILILILIGLTLFMLILEEGTHETLLARQGRYYELYSTQASYYS